MADSQNDHSIKMENNESQLSKYCYATTRVSAQAFMVYLIWIFIHWTSLQFYNQVCVPCSFWGLFIGAPAISQMPHCQTSLWIVYRSVEALGYMWLVFGSWLVAEFIIVSIK